MGDEADPIAAALKVGDRTAPRWRRFLLAWTEALGKSGGDLRDKRPSREQFPVNPGNHGTPTALFRHAAQGQLHRSSDRKPKRLAVDG